MSKNYDRWNEVKKLTDNKSVYRSFKNRDIFYINMGENIGNEQNGKGEKFIRPVVILKKITNDMFIGVPLSTQTKDGSWFYKFEFNKSGKVSYNIAIIPQMKMYSSKRLLNRIGKMKLDNFEELRVKIKAFI